MKAIYSFLMMLLVLASCTNQAEQNQTTVQVNVAELNRNFIDAWNNGQADAIKAMLADDVQFLQGDVRYNGKAEVAQKWVDYTIGTIHDLKTNVVSSGTDTEIAYEAGTFSVDVPAAQPDEPNAYGEGNFMLLWKKNSEGNWKLSYAQLEDHPLQVKN